MKVALLPLAIASLGTWILAGPFHGLLSRTLPFHFTDAAGAVDGLSGTWRIAADVLAAPATWLAVGVVAAGAALWAGRAAFARVGSRLGAVRRAIEAGYGFESANRGVVKAVQGTGEGLRVTQSGLLNWNVAAIVMAVIVVLCVVWFAGGRGG